MNERLQRFGAPLLILLLLLLLWEGLVTGLDIQQFLLPKPSAIGANLLRLVIVDPLHTADVSLETVLKSDRLLLRLSTTALEAETEWLAQNRLLALGTETQWILVRGKNLTPILQATWFTMKEALAGLLIGTTLGVLVALISARWTATREALLPFAIAANSMPIIAFAPIMNNWFGLDNIFSKIAIVAIMTFFPMMINCVRGLTSVDTTSLELMRSLAASEFAILRSLRIPNALPYFFSGLKVAASLSMIGAIVGEYFGGPRIALGVFITQEAALFRFDSAWSAIVIACLVGIGLYLIISLIERLSIPWHASFRT